MSGETVGGDAGTGTGATGSTTATAQTGAAAASTVAAPAQWWGADATLGLDADTQGWLQNKGWNNHESVAKALPDILKAYRSVESMVGKDKVVWPKDFSKSDDPAVKDIRSKMGVPDRWEDYGLQPLGADGKPIPNADKSYANAMAQAFHKLGIGKDAAAAIAAEHTRLGGVVQEAQQAAIGRQQAADHDRVMQAWGNDADRNLSATQHAFKALGMNNQDLVKLENAMGTEWMLNHLKTIGLGMAEDGGAGAGQGGGFMTAEAAHAKMQDLGKDTAWVKRYQEGGQAEAMEWSKLENIIAAASGRAA